MPGLTPSTATSNKKLFVLSLLASQFDALALGHHRHFHKEPKGYRLGDSLAGYGYSLDSQKIVDEQCYNATAGLPEGTSNVVSLSEATSFSDLQKEFSYSVDSGFGFGPFSLHADASYMRQIEDKDYSLSLNYFSHSSGTVRVQVGIGEDALTDAGKQEYTNNLTNPYFGIVCGDEVIGSYQQGALLAMSLKVDFSSHMDKEQFQASGSLSLGSIVNATAKVESITSQYDMKGKISLTAYQNGGDPGQLAKILSEDPSGNYYLLSCDMDNTDACKRAASGLLDYASNNFPNQFSLSQGTNITTLGFGFYDKQPIQHIGLVPPKSLLTNETLPKRNNLTSAYYQQLCYQDKFYSLFNGYPVDWETSSTFYQQLTSTYQLVKDNLDAISSGTPSGQGIKDCYLTPEDCGDIYQAIIPQIKQPDFAFLQMLQYYYKSILAIFYYNGGRNFAYKGLESGVGKVFETNFFDPNNISYKIGFEDCVCIPLTDPRNGISDYSGGHLQADNITIKGMVTCDTPKLPLPNCGQTEGRDNYRCKSPFFFDELARCNGDSRVVTESNDVCSPY